MVFKHYCYRSVIVSLGILLFYGCQPNRLQVKEEEAVGSSLSHTIGKYRDTMTPMQQSIQHSQKISPSDQSNEKPETTAQQEAATESVLAPSASCKRPISNESTSIVPAAQKAYSGSLLSHATPQASPSTTSDSLSLLELTVKRRGQDIEKALKEKKRTQTTADMDEESFEAFQAWFKKFAATVDNEEASCTEETSKAIAELAEEGDQSAYLTKSLTINMSELDWDTDFTPLHYAAARGNDQAVKALLKYVEVGVENKEKCTPLHFAAYAGYAIVARTLIDECKKQGNAKEILNAKDDQGSSPIFYAAGGPRDHGNTQVVASLLVESEVDPRQTLDNSTLLEIAASLGNVEVVKYCLTKIEEIVPQDSDVSPTIQSAAKLAKQEGQYDTLVMLQDYLNDHPNSINK